MSDENMSGSQLTTDEALEHLVSLIRKLFDDKIVEMKETQIKRRFEKELFTVLRTLAEEPSSDIAESAIWVQRLVYEILTQYVMFYGLQPGAELPIEAGSNMTDDEKVSAILRQEIIPNSWPYPQSVPF
jgi:hypothetical protein